MNRETRRWSLFRRVIFYYLVFDNSLLLKPAAAAAAATAMIQPCPSTWCSRGSTISILLKFSTAVIPLPHGYTCAGTFITCTKFSTAAQLYLSIGTFIPCGIVLGTKFRSSGDDAGAYPGTGY